MSELPQLPADRLSVVVFGPGFGESIVVHAPPGVWLIVDSLIDREGSTNPAIQLLDKHVAEPLALLLTHPHGDHAAGFDRFLDRWENAKVGYLREHVSASRDRLSEPDFEQSLRSGLAEHAVAAILDVWERFPDRKWDPIPGSSFSLGVATVTVLGPSKRAIRRSKDGHKVDPNALSGPLAIEWNGTRIVLGADLPASEWQRIVKDLPDIAPGDHHALKVPHHGSRSAQPALLVDPRDGRERFWALSPWKLAGGTLPRFEDDEGIDLLLGRVEQLHLTSLPFQASLKLSNKPMRRLEILNSMSRSRFGDDDMVLLNQAPPVTSEDAWVAVSYTANGALDACVSGAASVSLCR